MFEGDAAWQALGAEPSDTFAWDESSTCMHRPRTSTAWVARWRVSGSHGGSWRARELRRLIYHRPHLPAAPSRRSCSSRNTWSHRMSSADFNTYGRFVAAMHKVMMRGSFQREAGVTRPARRLDARTFTTGEIAPLYYAAENYRAAGSPAAVLAGNLRSGSCGDLGGQGSHAAGRARGHRRELERIHGSNLIGMGGLPAAVCRGPECRRAPPRRLRGHHRGPINFSRRPSKCRGTELETWRGRGGRRGDSTTLRTRHEGRYYEKREDISVRPARD